MELECTLPDLRCNGDKGNGFSSNKNALLVSAATVCTLQEDGFPGQLPPAGC
jgi:hypothetical protein